MKTTTLTLAVAAAVFVTACIPSVHPYYTDNDVVFEPGLVGTWQAAGEEEPDKWTFEPDENSHYTLTIHQADGKQGEFDATLFTLGNDRFIDLIPTDVEFATNQVDIAAAAMFPGHLLMHVAELEPNLKMAFVDFDWLEDHLENNPNALSHRREGGGILLTASTRQLQRFVRKHVSGTELFSDYGEFERLTAPAGDTP